VSVPSEETGIYFSFPLFPHLQCAVNQQDLPNSHEEEKNYIICMKMKLAGDHHVK
jgi:hypothetical protein